MKEFFKTLTLTITEDVLQRNAELQQILNVAKLSSQFL